MAALHSMTGFGAASRDAAPFVVRVEVRTVNHRGLQVKVRVPQEHGALESDVEARVRARLARGSVTVTVELARPSARPCEGLDVDAARRWVEALRGLQLELGVQGPVGLDLVVGLPGVIGSGSPEPLAPEHQAAVLAAVDAALDSLAEMRHREGLALERDLLDQAREIERLVALVRVRMPEVVRGHAEALRARVGELVGHAVPAADLAREVALLADRMVSEELTRLDSHVHQLRALLAEGGSVGRKLDFLAQELFREANTTGAKCNDAAVAHCVVDLKTHIERLREQVQNIE